MFFVQSKERALHWKGRLIMSPHLSLVYCRLPSKCMYSTDSHLNTNFQDVVGGCGLPLGTGFTTTKWNNVQAFGLSLVTRLRSISIFHVLMILMCPHVTHLMLQGLPTRHSHHNIHNAWPCSTIYTFYWLQGWWYVGTTRVWVPQGPLFKHARELVKVWRVHYFEHASEVIFRMSKFSFWVNVSYIQHNRIKLRLKRNHM